MITPFKSVFNLNILTTKTNIFVSISKFKTGEVLILKTPSALGFKNTDRRTLVAGQKVLKNIFQYFFSKFNLTDCGFIVNLRGKNIFLHKKLLSYIYKNLKINNVICIIEKQFFTHNGTPLEIKKRKKNRGKNKLSKQNTERFI